jgi:hypothetical protein
VQTIGRESGPEDLFMAIWPPEGWGQRHHSSLFIGAAPAGSAYNLFMQAIFRTRSSIALLSLLLLLALLPATAARQASGDEQFIRSLETGGPGAKVDEKRLARLFFSLAATLNGGKSSVQLLQSGVTIRNASADSVRAAVRARYFDYESAVERFEGSASELLDRSSSTPLLFKTLMDGHRACRSLGSYTRLAETYGVTSGRLLSILSSTEACERFTRAAFAPSVEAIVLRALSQAAEQEADMRVLAEELEALERLLEDLERIEER